MATPVAIGVDNGGTWIRIKGFNTKGRCIWALKKRSPSVEDLPRYLKKSVKRFHGALSALAVGSRGVWKQNKRRKLKFALKGLAKKIVVMSDVEAAWLAAFAPHPRYARPLPKGRGSTAVGLLPLGRRWPEGPDEGIIVISGTGSIAYGRRADGTFARAGGLGPDKGDEGSGFWIAKEWLLRTGQTKTLKRSVRQIASLAPKVLSRARRKDPVALAVIRSAQIELADLVRDLTRQLRLKPVRISCAGSVLENPWFRKGFFRALSPLSVIQQHAAMDAATALAKSIMGHASPRSAASAR